MKNAHTIIEGLKNALKSEVSHREEHIERVQKAIDFADKTRTINPASIQSMLNTAHTYHSINGVMTLLRKYDFNYPKAELTFCPYLSTDDIGCGAGMSKLMRF